MTVEECCWGAPIDQATVLTKRAETRQFKRETREKLAKAPAQKGDLDWSK